jgi:hypothetical protein
MVLACTLSHTKIVLVDETDFVPSFFLVMIIQLIHHTYPCMHTYIYIYIYIYIHILLSGWWQTLKSNVISIATLHQMVGYRAGREHATP